MAKSGTNTKHPLMVNRVPTRFAIRMASVPQGNGLGQLFLMAIRLQPRWPVETKLVDLTMHGLNLQFQ